MVFTLVKKSLLEDSETGITVRRGGASDIDMSSYVFCDPSNPTQLWKSSRPGEVQLSAYFIYEAPPTLMDDGRLKWPPIVGYQVSGLLVPFYAKQLGLKADSPEVMKKVAFARAKIGEALTVKWRSDPKHTRDPIIDTDGSLAQKIKVRKGITCLILKYES